jgi:septum formation protein
MIRKNGRVTGDAFYEAADVLFAPMSEAEIKAYVATGEPMDKAGAYAVQGIGGRFIRGIHGDFYTVMGLPMCRVYEKLRELQVLTEE